MHSVFFGCASWLCGWHWHTLAHPWLRQWSPVKDFAVSYEALNEEGTFSEGDTVRGAVTFMLTKETKVKSLFVKVKGDADVHWTEGSGDNEESYSAHRRYFKLKEFLVAENSEGTVLPKGIHRFKFRIKIPEEDMPSSFKGNNGKIVYMLEAKMSRSWRWPSTVQNEFKFVSKSSFQHDQAMTPLTDSVSKELGVFSKGQVKMWASINRRVCSPGDTVSVVAEIRNSSSKAMKPKFSFHQKIVCRADRSTDTTDKSLCKLVGNTVAQNSEQTVSCPMKIPDDITPSLHNCEILSVEYYLKVYLDISFALDPEVVFPLLIVPYRSAAHHPDGDVGPYPAGAVGAPSYSDFPPPAFPPFAGPAPAFPTGPHPASAGPGAYGYPAPDPTQKANTTSGYNNQWAQQTPPYSYPTAAFTPSSAQHQAPFAPPLSQREETPPTYSSLFPPSHNTSGRTGSDHKS